MMIINPTFSYREQLIVDKLLEQRKVYGHRSCQSF